MRKSVTLTENEKNIARTARESLSTIKPGQGVVVAFQKQDKTLRRLSGSLVEVKGTDDKEVAIIETVDGFRSANLSRIITVTAL